MKSFNFRRTNLSEFELTKMRDIKYNENKSGLMGG